MGSNLIKNSKKNESGIALDNELKIKSVLNDNLPIYVRMFQLVLIFMATICPIFSFLQGFKFKLNYFLIVAILIVGIVIEYIAFRIMKIYDQSLPAMLVVLVYCIFLVGMFKKISSGMLKIVEEYITYFNFNYNTDYILTLKVEKNAMKNATWLVLLIVLFVSLVMSYTIIVCVNKYIYLCVTAIWPMLCYSVGTKPKFSYFILYILISIIIFGMDSISKIYEISDEIHGGSKKQKMFKDIAIIKIGITIGVFALAICIIFNIVFSKSKYDKSTVLKNISENFRSSIENLTKSNVEQVDAFDREVNQDNTEDKFTINDLLIKKPVINNGKINDSGSVKFYNKNIFRVVSNEITETLYLKEYVGLKYNNGWIVDEKINNIEELSIYDNTLRDVLKKNKGKNVKQEIPYDLVSIISVDESRGGDLIPTGSNATYSMVKKGLVKYEKKPKVVAGYEFEFSNLNNLRDKIVYDISMTVPSSFLNIYTQVPEQHKNAIEKIKPELDNYIEKLYEINNNSIAFRNNKKMLIIRALVEYFNMNYTYTLHPGKAKKEIDPIEFFLLENKKGYCMYYAAAATSILRSYGIPTRYVEGYVLRTKDTEGAKRTKSEKYVNNLKDYDNSTYDFKNLPLYEYNVQDTNGHAWVEVFINGIGWVPVEVTSSQLSETREQAELEEALKEDDVVPTEEPSATENPSMATSEPRKETPQPTEVPTEKKDEKENKNNNINVYSLIGYTILIVLLTCGLLILCIKKLKIAPSVDKDKKLYEKNKMEYVYHMFNYLLAKNNIIFDNQTTYAEFIDKIGKIYPEYSLEKIDYVINFILKDNYSEEGINDDEKKEIIDFYNYVVELYENKTKSSSNKGKISDKRYVKKI